MPRPSLRSIFLFSLLLLLAPVAPAPVAAQDPDPGLAEKQQKWREDEMKAALGKLGDPDSVVRARAVEQLGRVGLKAAVEPLLTAGASEKYIYLASLIGETAATLDPEAGLAFLIDMVKRGGENTALKRNLVLLLREFPVERAGPLLLEHFGSSRAAEVRIEVIRSVGTMRLAEGASLLKSALGSTEMEDRNIAAIAAGQLGDPSLIPALLSGLEESKEFHAMFAALALNQIDDPSIFGLVKARLGNASGVNGEARAKVIEGSAREADIPGLFDLLKGSSSREYREAAAIALGRLGAKTLEVQEVLFARLLQDPAREVRGACWHALSRVANEELVPLVKKRLRQKKDSEILKYVFHLIGDLKISEAAPLLENVMITERRDDMLRYAASINYWKAASAEQIRRFEETLERGADIEQRVQALGFRRNPDGFRFAVRMLQVTKDGSREQFLVEKALERMTGHFFGPYPGTWKKWFEKHPEFFTPRQEELERNKWREEFDKENQGFRQTEETEYSVQLALEYLARHQMPDGRIDPNGFTRMCTDQPSCKAEGARFQLDPSGTTSLSILAFLGAGYTPTQGKYKHVVAKALDYLRARQQANGNFLTNDLIGGYTRPLGAQAFAEGFMVTGEADLGWYAQKSVDFLTTIQNQLGGWRYRVKIETTDTSCMSWNLFALKTAEKARLQVREIALTGCYHVMDLYSSPVTDVREEFIDTDPDYAFEVGRDTKYEFETGYQNPVWDTKYATVPLGIMCRIFLGWRRSHPFNIGSANKVLADLMEEIPRGDVSKYRSRREYPTYAWYYGTLAMHQMGGRYFREWNDRIKVIVPGTQDRTGCLRGSWPVWAHDTVAGRIYTTGMGALTLETYYRYLPVLQD